MASSRHPRKDILPDLTDTSDSSNSEVETTKERLAFFVNHAHIGVPDLKLPISKQLDVLKDPQAYYDYKAEKKSKAKAKKRASYKLLRKNIPPRDEDPKTDSSSSNSEIETHQERLAFFSKYGFFGRVPPDCGRPIKEQLHLLRDPQHYHDFMNERRLKKEKEKQAERQRRKEKQEKRRKEREENRRREKDEKPRHGKKEKPRHGKKEKPGQEKEEKPRQEKEEKPGQGKEKKPRQEKEEKPGQGKEKKPVQEKEEKSGQEKEEQSLSSTEDDEHVAEMRAERDLRRFMRQKKKEAAQVNPRVPAPIKSSSSSD